MCASMVLPVACKPIQWAKFERLIGDADGPDGCWCGGSRPKPGGRRSGDPCPGSDCCSNGCDCGCGCGRSCVFGFGFGFGCCCGGDGIENCCGSGGCGCGGDGNDGCCGCCCCCCCCCDILLCRRFSRCRCRRVLPRSDVRGCFGGQRSGDARCGGSIGAPPPPLPNGSPKEFGGGRPVRASAAVPLSEMEHRWSNLQME